MTAEHIYNFLYVLYLQKILLLIMTQGLKGLRHYLSKSEFSVKKQLMMKNIGKHTVKKMRELRYEVIKN